jgi:hypothetical protein
MSAAGGHENHGLGRSVDSQIAAEVVALPKLSAMCQKATCEPSALAGSRRLKWSPMSSEATFEMSETRS